MKLKLLTAVAALVACSGVLAEEKTVTICEDFISDGGYDFWWRPCVEAQSEAQKAKMRAIVDGQAGGKYLADQRQIEADRCYERLNEMFPDGRPPKTIERRCETYIDNRAKEG